MPFIPHTEQDVESMLARIGIQSTEELFDEIPSDLGISQLEGVADGISEMAMLELMSKRAKENQTGLCFMGAGCYDHHIPSAVWDITSRGEFLTAYTPYQAEASQGTLQLLYEFQTMLASLTGMEVANASVYDGATAVAEAILMALRVQRRPKSRKVLVASSIHPNYLATVETIVKHQGIELVSLPLANGVIDPDQISIEDAAALVIQQPNFYGMLEEVDTLTRLAHQAGAAVIGVVNPLTLGILKPPGEWAEDGADIACGDGQPLGIPMASGGPSLGFLCTKLSSVRQMPGRIAGKTVDGQNNSGFVLTLQAREQHIRREKATSNICTNQGLLVTAATIYMTLLGPDGLQQAASRSYTQTHELVERLTDLPDVSRRYSGPYFHECAIDFPQDGTTLQSAMLENEILAGCPLKPYLKNSEQTLLVCATEKRNSADIDQYLQVYKHVSNNI